MTERGRGVEEIQIGGIRRSSPRGYRKTMSAIIPGAAGDSAGTSQKPETVPEMLCAGLISTVLNGFLPGSGTRYLVRHSIFDSECRLAKP